MTEDEKRTWVSNLYSGKKWKARVRKMSDAQVYAIWIKEYNKPPKPPEPDKPDSLF